MKTAISFVSPAPTMSPLLSSSVILSVLFLVSSQTSWALDSSDVEILESHQVVYSSAPINTDYASNSKFNARGMQYVYVLSHTFMNLIQRRDVFPASLNASVLLDTPQEQVRKKTKTCKALLPSNRAFSISVATRWLPFLTASHLVEQLNSQPPRDNTRSRLI